MSAAAVLRWLRSLWYTAHTMDRYRNLLVWNGFHAWGRHDPARVADSGAAGNGSCAQGQGGDTAECAHGGR